MSHYKPYPAYKDSGVEWLGKVPEHWELRSLKQLARLDGGAGFPDDEQGIQDAPIPFFKVADLANGMTTAENYITEATAARLRAKIFPEGTIAFAKVGAALLLNRRVLMHVSGCADNNMMVVCPREADGKWLLLVLSCFDMSWLVNPGAVPSVNQEQVGNIKIPMPSMNEQKKIVSRLDRETARIDALITKKTRFIELLREKRQALITHAVTQGLDPNVKMKDSGVEWLGEVPEHWGVRPLKQLARLDGGAGFPDDEQGSKDAPIPFFKVADLANGMTTAENHITPEAAERLRAKIFPTGTIAFAKVGAALLLNRRVMMPISGCADNNMMVAIPHGISGEWLLSVLSCFDMAWLVNPGAVPSVNQEQVGNIKIPVPGAEEQVSILVSVRSGTTRIDALSYKTERSIELLKERRSALITAAVTGQIDLREAIDA